MSIPLESQPKHVGVDDPPLFPLSLSPFEHSMLIDDSPSYPMAFKIEVQLSGFLDKGALSESLLEALIRHPLLCCRVKWQGGLPKWNWSASFAPRVQFFDNMDRHPSEGIEFLDLTNECGLRLWAHCNYVSTQLIFQFHHACCDGVGSLQFFADLCFAYARRTGDASLIRNQSLLEPQCLMTRHHVLKRRVVANPPRLLARLRGMIREHIKHFRSKPVSLAVPGNLVSPLKQLEHEIQSLVLDTKTSHGLRRVSLSHGVTVNDILTRDLLLTLQDWNLLHNDHRKEGALRILVPVNLRAKGDELLPAANLIGYAFVTRRARDLADPDELLKGIAHDTRAIHRYKLAWIYLDGLARLKRLRLLKLSHLILGRRCQATAIHSHLGTAINLLTSKLERVGERALIGNLQLEEIIAVPPIRSLTHLAVASYWLGNRLMVNLRCDPHKYSSAHAKLLLEMFVKRISTTA